MSNIKQRASYQIQHHATPFIANGYGPAIRTKSRAARTPKQIREVAASMYDKEISGNITNVLPSHTRIMTSRGKHLHKQRARQTDIFARSKALKKHEEAQKILQAAKALTALPKNVQKKIIELVAPTLY